MNLSLISAACYVMFQLTIYNGVISAGSGEAISIPGILHHLPCLVKRLVLRILVLKLDWYYSIYIAVIFLDLFCINASGRDRNERRIFGRGRII
jgi:hypothetical protein